MIHALPRLRSLRSIILPRGARGRQAGALRAPARDTVITVLVALAGAVLLALAVSALSKADCRRGAVSYFHTAQPCSSAPYAPVARSIRSE